jgi:hypothetical protein
LALGLGYFYANACVISEQYRIADGPVCSSAYFMDSKSIHKVLRGVLIAVFAGFCGLFAGLGRGFSRSRWLAYRKA